MFAVRRIIRSKFNVKNHLHTSSVTRCDEPKDPGLKENKPKKKKNIKDSEGKLVSSSASKKKLTAELNAKDYANFKSQRLSKVELYSEKSNTKENLEAKKTLQALIKEAENEVNVSTPVNKKFETLAVAKPKRKEKANSKNKLVESVKAVALELGGDAKKTEGDILGYLRTLELKIEKNKLKEADADFVNKQEQTPTNFNADKERDFRENKPGFFSGRRTHSGGWHEQQVEHSGTTNQDSGHNVRDRWQQHEFKIRNIIMGEGVYKFQSLGLFKASDFKDDGPKLKTWDEIEEWELQFAATLPPRNYFEELIQWTKEGKLWHFPIDNDQGNELEANVDFTEHIFLEEHLEPWCPKRGPLRHFMELVLTGLSKNHYLSVEEKKEHIYWYRDYFQAKKNLLQEMGTLDKVLLEDSAKSNSEHGNPE